MQPNVHDPNRVPGADCLRYLDWLAEDRPFAFDDVKQPKIALQGIEPRDVVVVFILAAPDGSSALVELSRDRFERAF